MATLLASVISIIVLIPISMIFTQHRIDGIDYGILTGIPIAIWAVNFFLLKKKIGESIITTIIFLVIFALTLYLTMKLYCSIITCVIDMIFALELSFLLVKIFKR